MGRIDLHTHSTASDGSMKPAELVRHAKRCGLAAVALTDHDTVDGIEEALEEGNRIGIEVIPGLEISADFDPEMHLLGYFFHENYRRIRPVLDELKQRRNERNPKIVKKLQQMGFDITLEEAVRESGGSVVGRPHIAQVLVKKGYVASVSEAFERYLSHGRPAYFKKSRMTPEEGVRAIAEAGGIPVLAHPIYLYLDPEVLEGLVSRLKNVGLMGVEAFYVDNTPVQNREMEALAVRHGLVATGGSDFHGKFKPDIEIGIGRGNLEIPERALQELKQAAELSK